VYTVHPSVIEFFVVYNVIKFAHKKQKNYKAYKFKIKLILIVIVMYTVKLCYIVLYFSSNQILRDGLEVGAI